MNSTHPANHLYFSTPPTDIILIEDHEYVWPLLLLTPIILCSTMGNVMVCIAVASVPKLQNYNNYFLFSLAVADLMVSVLVMPMGLAKDFVGYWIMSSPLCHVWITLDVLCCTASILHISIISTDRYLAICRPIRFQQRRRRRQSTACKIMAVWLISSALSSPLLVMSLSNQSGFVDNVSCAIQNRHFAIYGSVVAFYLPLLIIVVTYLLTAVTLYRKSAAFTKADHSQGRSSNAISNKSSLAFKNLVQQNKSSLQTIPSPSDLCDGEQVRKEPKFLRRTSSDSITHTPNFQKLGRRVSSAGSVHTQAYVSTLRRSTLRSSSSSASNHVTNERRANQVLFLVFLVFVLGWTPFFVMNVYYAICENCVAGDALFQILTWVGWASSMINPFIYTAFNRVFRKAFWDILTCRLVASCKKDKTCCYSMPSASVTNSSTGVKRKPSNKSTSSDTSKKYLVMTFKLPEQGMPPAQDV